MKRATGRMAGFSLLEIMIVLAIAAAAVTLGVTWLNAERARSLRGAAADDTAREIATMARALGTYLATATTLPASGAFDVQHQTLVDAGLLPPGYAMRDVAGTPTLVSPLYQAYSLRAIKVGTKYRGAVFVNAASDPVGGSVPLRKIGLENTEQGTFDFASVAMRRAREKFLITSAVVRKGASATDLPLSGFAADLASLLGAPAARPVLAALVGFTELSANPDIKVSVDPASLAGGGDGGLNLEGRECRMVAGLECSANEEKVWERGYCEGATDLEQPGIVSSSITRTVTIGSNQFNVISTLNFAALGEINGIGAAQYSSFFYASGSAWSLPSNWGSWVPEISSTVNALGFRSDNLVIVPGSIGRSYTVGADAISESVVSAAPGTTYSRVAMLPSCGGQMEIPTYVYRVESGRVAWNAGSYAPASSLMTTDPQWPYAAGTQFMSVVDPANAGRPVQAVGTKVQFGPYPTVLCEFRALASEYNGNNGISTNAGNFSSRFGETSTFYSSRFNSHCPAVTNALRNYADGAALGTRTAYPVRAYGYKYSKGETYKYCCRK